MSGIELLAVVAHTNHLAAHRHSLSGHDKRSTRINSLNVFLLRDGISQKTEGDTKKIWKIKIEYYVTWSGERNRSIISAHSRTRSLSAHPYRHDDVTAGLARGLFSRKTSPTTTASSSLRASWEKENTRWARWESKRLTFELALIGTSHLVGCKKLTSSTLLGCVGAWAFTVLGRNLCAAIWPVYDRKYVREMGMKRLWLPESRCWCVCVDDLSSVVGGAFQLLIVVAAFLTESGQQFGYLCNIVCAIISGMNQN